MRSQLRNLAVYLSADPLRTVSWGSSDFQKCFVRFDPQPPLVRVEAEKTRRRKVTRKFEKAATRMVLALLVLGHRGGNSHLPMRFSVLSMTPPFHFCRPTGSQSVPTLVSGGEVSQPAGQKSFRTKIGRVPHPPEGGHLGALSYPLLSDHSPLRSTSILSLVTGGELGQKRKKSHPWLKN